jgi:hypothetical protein
MIRVILIILCLLSSCSSKTNISKNDKKDEKYIKLFSEELKERAFDNVVNSLLKEIINSNDDGKFDSIQKFILLNELYGSNGLFFLIDNNYSGLAQWLNKNCGVISEVAWNNLPNEFGSHVPKMVNTDIQISILNCIMHLSDPYRVQQNLVILNSFAGYQCAKLAMQYLLSARDKDVRIELYIILAKFNTTEFNTVLKKLIFEKVELDAIECVNKFSFDKHNRYDFLPELKQLRASLKKEKDPAKIGLQKSLIEQLEKTIPVLETKKAENAPIGLPLDWPGDGM